MRSFRRPVAAALLLCACGGKTPPATSPTGPAPSVAPDAAPVTVAPPSAPDAAPPKPATPIADAYRDVAAKILTAALADEQTWKRLEHLTDHIGARLSGMPSLDAAITWAQEQMKADGQENVHAEKVMVPHWIRGEGTAELTTPEKRDLPILALGGSGATPKKGITADVVAVSSWAELDALGDKAKGKIVLFNVVMAPYKEGEGTHYGVVAPYRLLGPARAAKLGAVAALFRSATAHSLRTPHTGATIFRDVKPIPAAAVTTEDADLIARYLAAGDPVTVHLTLGCRSEKDVPSANVIGELRGREAPDEVVVIGAHIDSWDVGEGAHDDGGGVVIVMQALATLRRLGLTPRRTIRVVLFTNEENGIRGASAYAEAHKDELAKHVAGIETDEGSFHPEGFGAQVGEGGLALLTDAASLLDPLGATHIEAGHAGTDVGEMAGAGVPLLGLSVDNSHYFDVHHTQADTLDKVNPDELKQCVATMATMAYVLADMPTPLPRQPPPETKQP